MANPDLVKKITEGIRNTGYPLEQRVGHCLQSRGWHPFHAVSYWEPKQGTQRELDILAYKIIQERRIELRISCKRSVSKQWVFFTEDASRYVETSSDLKITPIPDHPDTFRRRHETLKDLPFFKHKRRAINFTALAGDKMDKEAKSLMRDGLLSAISSVYHRIYPHHLFGDVRGHLYLFVTVFDGLMFESFYDPQREQDQVIEINYAQWRTLFPLETRWKSITNDAGRRVLLANVLFWFSEIFRVEVMTWNHFPNYLEEVERAFAGVQQTDLNVIGMPWKDEFFPRTGQWPSIHDAG